MRKAFQTDLSDEEWEILEPHLPVPKAPGRPRLHPLREILNAVFYVVRGGCAWRLLPHDLERRGGPSTTTSGPGASTAPESGCTKPFAGGRGFGSDETRSPAPASSTARA
jgi:transposase